MSTAGTSAARAEEPEVTARMRQQGKAFAHVFFVEELLAVVNGLPLVRVKFGKVLLYNGEFVERIHLRYDERQSYKSILRRRPGFRLYLRPDQAGIFRYVEAKGTGHSGIILTALPLDKDATLRDLTADARARSRLENLLSLSMDDAADVLRREQKVEQAIGRWTELELKSLESPESGDFRAFFVQTVRPQ